MAVYIPTTAEVFTILAQNMRDGECRPIGLETIRLVARRMREAGYLPIGTGGYGGAGRARLEPLDAVALVVGLLAAHEAPAGAPVAWAWWGDLLPQRATVWDAGRYHHLSLTDLVEEMSRGGLDETQRERIRSSISAPFGAFLAGFIGDGYDFSPISLSLVRHWGKNVASLRLAREGFTIQLMYGTAAEDADAQFAPIGWEKHMGGHPLTMLQGLYGGHVAPVAAATDDDESASPSIVGPLGIRRPPADEVGGGVARPPETKSRRAPARRRRSS